MTTAASRPRRSRGTSEGCCRSVYIPMPRDLEVACSMRRCGLRGRPGRECQRPEWKRRPVVGLGCRSVPVRKPHQLTPRCIAGLGAHDATQLWIAWDRTRMTISARDTMTSLRVHVSHRGCDRSRIAARSACTCTPSSPCRTDASRYRRPPVSREDWSAALCAAQRPCPLTFTSRSADRDARATGSEHARGHEAPGAAALGLAP